MVVTEELEAVAETAAVSEQEEEDSEEDAADAVEELDQEELVFQHLAAAAEDLEDSAEEDVVEEDLAVDASMYVAEQVDAWDVVEDLLFLSMQFNLLLLLFMSRLHKS